MISALYIEFTEALSEVEVALENLNAILMASELPSMVVGPGGDKPLKATTNIYSQLDYVGDVKGNEVVTVVGAAAILPSTADLVHKVNAAKSRFDTIKKKLGSLTVPDPVNDEKPCSALRYHLIHNLKRPRLHLTQTARKIVILDKVNYAPARIGFVATSSVRRIRRKSWQSVYDALSRKGDSDEVQRVLDMLTSIPNDEVLAEVTHAAKHYRANVTWVGEGGEKLQLQRRVSMPILYVVGDDNRVPLISGPYPEREGRAVRLDTQIEGTAICPMLNIYRYTEPFRESKKGMQ